MWNLWRARVFLFWCGNANTSPEHHVGKYSSVPTQFAGSVCLMSVRFPGHLLQRNFQKLYVGLVSWPWRPWGNRGCQREVGGILAGRASSESHPVEGLCRIDLLVVLLVLILQTNCLLFTYLGQWMMKVFEQSLVTVERFSKLRWSLTKNLGGLMGLDS